jgi:hypothetical protein
MNLTAVPVLADVERYDKTPTENRELTVEPRSASGEARESNSGRVNHSESCGGSQKFLPCTSPTDAVIVGSWVIRSIYLQVASGDL